MGGVPFHLFEVVQDADQCTVSLALFFLEQGENVFGPILIKAGNGLVGKEDDGTGEQGSGNGQALSFAP